MEDLRVTLLQSNLFWEDKKKNLDHFNHLLEKTGPSDLILLPETFNTGFSINPDTCAEPPEGPSTAFLREQAKKKDAVVMATLLIREGKDCFNRLVVMYPDGHAETYDKRHLFRLSEEQKIFSAGNRQLIVEVKGWKIMTVICYDLRFPVWIKNTYRDGKYGYDTLVCLANWPASRAHVWKTMMMARAMENQVYAAGVNRIGEDGNGTWHSGDSMAVDPRGNVLFAAEPGRPVTGSVIFSAAELALFRESFTVGMDWDDFTINLK